MAYMKKISKTKIDRMYRQQVSRGTFEKRRRQVEINLRNIGAHSTDLHIPEIRFLPLFIRTHEKIIAILQGNSTFRHDQEIKQGMLIATSQRLLFLKKNSATTTYATAPYSTIASIDVRPSSISCTVTVSISDTHLPTFSVRSNNAAAVYKLADVAEQHVFDAVGNAHKATASLLPLRSR